MVRRYGESITVQVQQGLPIAFVWRSATYHVRVIGSWRLATRWWEIRHAVDRTYFRVETSDHQVFELYCETAAAGKDHGQHSQVRGERWVLDTCLD